MDIFVANVSIGPLSNQDGNSVVSDKLGLPLNTEKSVDVVNSGAGVMENFSNCNTLSESQNEIDIHIRDEDPGATLAKEGSQEMIPTSLFTEDETVPESPSSSSKTTLQTDVVQDNSAASFECGVCSAVFRSKSGLQRHISFHNNQDGKSFICPHCYKMYSSRADLNVHLETHADIRHKCSSCGKHFSCKNHLIRHIRNVHDTHKCPHCREKFLSQASLDLHQAVHNKNCPYCSKVFTVGRNLLRHVAMIHDDKDWSEPLSESTVEVGDSNGVWYDTPRPLHDHFIANRSMGPLSNQDGNSACSDKPCLPLNTEKSVNVVNSGADVMQKFSNCTALSESQSEIDNRIRDEDPDVTLAKERSQEMIPSSLFTEDETVTESSSSSSKSTVQTVVVQANLAASFECSVCSAVFRGKDGLRRHISFHDSQEGKSFICPHCHKKYSSRADLNVHLETHADIRHKCPSCGKHFSCKSHLTSHIRNVHDTHKCPHCREKFLSQAALDLHQAVHDKNCPYCSKVFTERRNLLGHVAMVHDDKDWSESTVQAGDSNGSNLGKDRFRFTNEELDMMKKMSQERIQIVNNRSKKKTRCCWICQKTFYKQAALIRHIQAHTGERTVPCDHCDRLFANEGEQRSHMRFINLEKRFKCEQCGKGFKQKSLLNIHLLGHSSERPFQCPHCPKSYKFKKKLDDHLCSVHTGDTPYECRHCEERFPNSRQRLRHETVKHDIPKRYKCSHCPETFKTFSQRRTHSKSHITSVLRCDHCPYETVFKNNMKQHKVRHSNEKPYSCDQCPKRYSQSARLYIHKRSHTGEKPYACDQCEKGFVDSYSLKRHARTHTGEKPYKCSYCDRSFAQGCQRQFHERTHTGEKPYECSQCEKKFPRRQELNKHLTTHEKEKEKQHPAKKKRKTASKKS